MIFAARLALLLLVTYSVAMAVSKGREIAPNKRDPGMKVFEFAAEIAMWVALVWAGFFS